MRSGWDSIFSANFCMYSFSSVRPSTHTTQHNNYNYPTSIIYMSSKGPPLDRHGRPIPAKEALTLEIYSTRTFGTRLFVVKMLHGIPKPGSKDICNRIFKGLDNIKGSKLTKIKLQPTWPCEDTWNFSMASHDEAVEMLKHCKLPIIPVPKHILELFSRPRNRPPTDSEIQNKIGHEIWSTLMPFQKDGVRFGTSLNGCVLIGDEMGLGKTFQGLSIASFYSEDWPLLIVCPSSLRHSWYNNMLDHSIPLKNDKEQICLLGKGADKLWGKVVILSYAMLQQKALMVRLLKYGFKSILLDECHYIKSALANRTKQALKLCARAKHRILLSGTPMARSKEIFTQIKAVDPSIFPQFWAPNGQNPWNPDRFFFSVRYCEPAKQYRGYKQWVWKHMGNERHSELNAVLQRNVMIRRRKMNVLKDLPLKVRERVVIDELQGRRLVDFQDELDRVSELRQEQGSVVGDPAFMALVRETAKQKVDLVAKYMKEVIWEYLEGNPTAKVIVFGHHSIMLNRIQEETEKAEIGFMRIDGSTARDVRHKYVDSFQEDPKVRVAILSICAAGAGLTLTAANIVIMAELLYGPDFMFQAEDRAHRIGQDQTVFIRYLMMKGSTDDILWKMITSKTRNVGRILDNRAEYLVAKEISTTANLDKQRTMEESISEYMESTEAIEKKNVGIDASIGSSSAETAAAAAAEQENENAAAAAEAKAEEVLEFDIIVPPIKEVAKRKQSSAQPAVDVAVKRKPANKQLTLFQVVPKKSAE